jgi:putative copper export protein
VSIDDLSIGLRALSFIAIFQAGGAAIFVALFGRIAPGSQRILRKIGILVAMAGLVFTAGHYALEAARMAGEFAGIFDSSLQHLVFESSASTALAWRLGGLTLIAIGLSLRNTAGVVLALIGTALTVSAFTLLGHTVESPMRWALGVALIAHLLAVAFWFGGLVPLYLVSRREALNVAAAVVDRYSLIASRVVPALFVAGLLLAMLLLARLSDLITTPYGLIILGKVTLFAVLMGLATLNKWRYGPAMASGDTSACISFQRSVLAELALISLILAMTAILTTLYSPT